MKQSTMFNSEFEDNKSESEYTTKIKSPVYEVKNKKPDPFLLVDRAKYASLKNKIDASNISEDEKRFLYMASTRHLVFNYELIADFYAHSSKEVQELMEDSALVIIDFNKAIEKGYVKLNKQTAELYGKDYSH